MNNKHIELNIKPQNWNTVKISLKFWGPHETRLQQKVWGKKIITTTFEKAVNECIAFVKINYSMWVIKRTYDEYEFPWEYCFYQDLKTKLEEYNAFNTKNYKFAKPNQIYKIEHIKDLTNTQNRIKEIKNTYNITNKKLQKYLKRIEKRNLSKFFWSKWKSFQNKTSILIRRSDNLKEDIIIFEEQIYDLEKETNSIELKIIKYSGPDIYEADKISVAANSMAPNLIWFPMKTFLMNIDNLKGEKGVYILWNKTISKYYVGQTKDLYKRIGLQHFNRKTGLASTVHFKDDYNAGHEFLITTISLTSKDDLDETERKYIALFDSFFNGYNSTSGNV